MNSTPFVLIIISDRAHSGVRQDETAPKVAAWCESDRYSLFKTIRVPDQCDAIANAINSTSDDDKVKLIITSGGTGFSEKDITPEVTRELIVKLTPGIDEYLRRKGADKTPYAVLSRGISGILQNKLIINLPGNPVAVIESLEWLKDILPHAFSILNGNVNDGDHRYHK